MIRTISLAMFAVAVMSPVAASAQGMTPKPIVRLMTQAPGTPGNMGLLAVLMAEVHNVERHVRFAASRTGNLDWTKGQAIHVLHAISPEKVADGRGLGYGLRKAIAAVGIETGKAAGEKNAADAVKLHATHVAASLSNSMSRAESLAELAEKVIAAPDPVVAAPLVRQMQDLTRALISGVDADGNGTVSWEAGEGGIEQVERHLELMAAAAG
jgi:hypothetical protein